MHTLSLFLELCAKRSDSASQFMERLQEVSYSLAEHSTDTTQHPQERSLHHIPLTLPGWGIFMKSVGCFLELSLHLQQ